MAENSQIYMPLALSPPFMNRVQYILVEYAPTVLVEASSVAGHAKRAALAATIAAAPGSYASVFAVHLAANVNVTTAGALTGTTIAQTLDSPVTDAALFAAVAVIWNTVAGVIVNP